MRQALSAILPDTNTATLSGAVDIIAVHSADGTLATTAWHVRFGLLKVVQSRERPVTIRVNGVEADEKSCRMVLSAAGEGRFVAGSAQKAPGVAGGSDEQALAAHPPPDWLRCLRLQGGRNEVCFSVRSRLHGETEVTTNLFLSRALRCAGRHWSLHGR